MFTNQPFTENKAVINRKIVQICCSISQPLFTISKIHPLLDAAFSVDILTPFRILKIVTVSVKNGF